MNPRASDSPQISALRNKSPRAVARLLVGLLCTGLAMAQAKAPEDPLIYGLEVPVGAVAILEGEAIGEADFVQELVDQQLRAGREGTEALDSLIEEALITRGLRKSALKVDDQDLDKKVADLDARVRKELGRSLAATIAEEGVPMGVFRRKLKRVIALEKLARKDLPVPADQEVQNWQMTTWLAQAKESVPVRRAPKDSLPAGIAAEVDGRPITHLELAKELAVLLKPDDLVRVARVLLEERVMNRVLGERGLALSAADFEHEYQVRKASFQKDPKFTGVSYEEVLLQQTGLDANAWRNTREFRIAAGRGLLARRSYSPNELAEAYETYKDRYGPIYTLSHILIRATEDEKLAEKSKIATKAEGKKRIDLIRAELAKGLKFADAARQFSMDRGSQFRGGALSAATPGRNPFEPGILEAVQGLEVGAVGEPVWTRVGWHLVRLDNVEPPPAYNEEIEVDLQRFLVSQLFVERMQKAKLGWNLRRFATPSEN